MRSRPLDSDSRGPVSDIDLRNLRARMQNGQYDGFEVKSIKSAREVKRLMLKDKEYPEQSTGSGCRRRRRRKL